MFSYKEKKKRKKRKKEREERKKEKKEKKDSEETQAPKTLLDMKNDNQESLTDNHGITV